MNLEYVMVIWSVCLSASFLAEGYTVTCYNCFNTRGFPEPCPWTDPSLETTKTETHTRAESDIAFGMWPGCFKERSKNVKTGEVTIKREFGLVGKDYKVGCTSGPAPNPDYYIDHCFCWDNYCNGSTPFSSNASQTVMALCILGSILVAYIRK